MDKIDEFALQSQKEYGDFDGSNTAFDYRKFAELIIRECVQFCELADKQSRETYESLLDTEEIAAAAALGASYQAKLLKARISQHFGIE